MSEHDQSDDLLNGQAADERRIAEIADKAKREIAALINERLTDEERRVKKDVIERQACTEAGPFRTAMAERHGKAARLGEELSPEAYRKAALRAADPAKLTATFAVLRLMPTAELYGWIEHAANAGDLASVEAARYELQGRADRDPAALAAAFRSVKLPPSVEEDRQRLSRVMALKGSAEAKLLAMIRSHDSAITTSSMIRGSRTPPKPTSSSRVS